MAEEVQPNGVEFEKATSTELDSIYLKFAGIFNMNACNQQLFDLLQTISVPSNAACLKKIDKLYLCLDCSHDNSSCLCTECFEDSKEQHKGHNLSFHIDVPGSSCDCGDLNAWKQNGCCSKHKGALKTDEEVYAYLSKSFSEDQLKELRITFNELFAKIHYVITNKVVSMTYHRQKLHQLFIFLIKIFQANQALVHVASEFFIKSYLGLTKHKCIKITPSSVEIMKNEEEEHQCSCSFIHLIFQVFGPLRIYDSLLYLLIASHKLKIVMGLSYFTLFPFIAKFKFESILVFAIQLFNPEVNSIILESQEVMNYYIDKCYELVESNLPVEIELFTQGLVSFFNKFHFNLTYLTKFNTYTQMNNHLYFYKRVIDMCSLLHNVVSFTFGADEMDEEKDKYNFNMAVIEETSINSFSFIISLLDFSSYDKANELLNYFIELFNKKDYKQLGPDEYSFHTPLSRAFTIFITHYLFTYSVNMQVDLKSALVYLMTLNDFDYEPIIKETMKSLGFVLSIKHKYWMSAETFLMIYPGILYEPSAYRTSSFGLIQLLCAYPKYSHLLSIDSLLQSTSINGSYETLKTLLIKTESDIDSTDIEWVNKEDSVKALFYGNDVIDLLFHLQTNNSYLISLYFHSFEDIKNWKIEIERFAPVKLFIKDALISIIKRTIALTVLANGNYCPFSLIEKALKNLFSILNDQNAVIQIINEILLRNTSNNNQKITFSLKPQCYDLIDLSELMHPTQKSDIERYIMEFKKKEISILQSSLKLTNPAYESLTRDFNTAAFSAGNVQWICLFTIAQLSNVKWANVLRYSLSDSLKHLAALLSASATIIDTNPLQEAFEVLSKYSGQLVSLLDKPGVALDETQSALCLYLKEQMNKCPCINIDQAAAQQQGITSQDKHVDNKKKELQSKYKTIFKEKNKQFSEAMGLSSELSDPKSNTEGQESLDTKECLCMICKVEINKDLFYSNPFGRFGLISNDVFLYNTKYHSIARKYKENSILNSKEPFKSFLEKDPYFKKSNQIRMLTCNHFVHFTCYNEFIIQNTNQCPFCKQVINAFFPYAQLNPIEQRVQGLSLEQFMENVQKKQEPLVDEASFRLSSDAENCQWLFPITNYLEEILFKIDEQKKILKDVNKEEGLLEKAYEQLLECFRGFFIFYDNYTTNQISLLNTFISSIRLAIKLDMMRADHFYSRFKSLIETMSPASMDLTKGQLRGVIEEVLFLFLVLFGESSKEKEVICLMRMFLPLIFIEMYVKEEFTKNEFQLNPSTINQIMSYDKVTKYLEDNSSKGVFSFYFLIFYVCYQLLDTTITGEEKSQMKSNDSIAKCNYLLQQMKLSEFASKPLLSLLSLQCPSFLPHPTDEPAFLNQLLISSMTTLSQKEQPIVIPPGLFCIDIERKFKFIDLPPNMQEYTEMMNTLPCEYCKNTNSIGVLCLICGAKVCGRDGCHITLHHSNQKIESYLFHSILCGRGYSVFIDLKWGELFFIINGTLISNPIFVYLNQFGEEPKQKHKLIQKDFVLSQIELDKAASFCMTYYYK